VLTAHSTAGNYGTLAALSKLVKLSLAELPLVKLSLAELTLVKLSLAELTLVKLFLVELTACTWGKPQGIKMEIWKLWRRNFSWYIGNKFSNSWLASAYNVF
jgi:hypothetical protein